MQMKLCVSWGLAHGYSDILLTPEKSSRDRAINHDRSINRKPRSQHFCASRLEPADSGHTLVAERVNNCRASLVVVSIFVLVHRKNRNCIVNFCSYRYLHTSCRFDIWEFDGICQNFHLNGGTNIHEHLLSWSDWLVAHIGFPRGFNGSQISNRLEPSLLSSHFQEWLRKITAFASHIHSSKFT